jgi:glycosyltransferase involved in cell wall biosynthesis
VDRPRLKVLYISRGYTVHDRRFLSSFAEQGWDVTHLPLIDERLEDRPLPGGVASLPPTSSREDLAGILGRIRPDVVIAGPVQTGAYMASVAGAKPLVTVSWGTDILVDADRSPEMSAITRKTLDNSSAVFGDCRAVREAVKRHSSLRDSDIVTFPWGIDLENFTPGESSLSLRKDLGWEDATVFISTRTWEAVYATDVLVEAFARVHAARPDARLILLGNGSKGQEIHALIDARGLDDLVHAPGRISHTLLPEYFRAADVYVSSALSDGTSISLLEAMATGLPVVVSDSYGNLEWVQPGVNGELARPGDAELLAEAMIAVASDERTIARMRAANVATARLRADWSKNFPLLARKIESLAAK